MRTVAGRLAAVVALVVVTLLGNLRLQASEAPHAPTAFVASVSTGQPTNGGRAATVDPSTDEDGSPDADDAVQLVPAIYAWDPDVRFVYFRHVSKWM